ncbi:MAG: hypothetical protein ABIS50_24880 [Luteolibacter sp.]|uniref:tetratricopeptide repeat protein n=1 Tax=Luteolibacter sp. TaxID=1962973 RepID=UPI0032636453
MNPRKNRLILAAAVLLLTALGIILISRGDHPVSSVARADILSGKKTRSDLSESHDERGMPRSRAPKVRQEFSNFVKLMGEGDPPKLSAAQLETYVNSAGRNVDSLLAAFRLGKDEAYLKEALEKFPHNPQVLLEAARMGNDPAKRLEILDRMRSEAPGNGLVDLMSAKALFDLGKDEEAFARLRSSAGKPLDDFTRSSWQNGEEAYASAGYSAAEAKLSSMYSLTKPEAIQSRGMGDKLVKLRQGYEAAGDHESAEMVVSAQLELARQIGDGACVVEKLVGLVHEKMVVKGDESPEADEIRADIVLRRDALVASANKVSEMMKSTAVPESDWVNYFDRTKLFGENAANDWLLEKYPQH